jgi:hypothetical protein
MIGRKVITYYDDPTDVISLSQAKAHLDVLRTDQDSLLETYIGAAIKWAANILGFEIRRAQVEYYFDEAETKVINPTASNYRYGLRIPANVLDLTALYYRNESLTYTAMTATDYDFISAGEHIPFVKILEVPVTFADHGASYKAVVTEGYYNIGSGSTANDGDLLPDDVKIAILLKIRDLYDFRGNEVLGNVSQLNATAEHYLFPHSKKMIV